MTVQQKKNILIAVALVLAIAVSAAVWAFTRPETASGGKTFTVDIVYDETEKTVEITTDAEYLRGALEQENLVRGEESEYGLFVTEVDGRTADSDKQEWWCFTKNNGETVNTGIDETPIAHGDKFEITLMTGW